MQRSDLSLLTVLGALATFVGVQTVATGRPHRTESGRWRRSGQRARAESWSARMSSM
jgi:hypothetical protein